MKEEYKQTDRLGSRLSAIELAKVIELVQALQVLGDHSFGVEDAALVRPQALHEADVATARRHQHRHVTALLGLLRWQCCVNDDEPE